MTFEQLLASDSIFPHEKTPHGVPASYDWQAGPVTHHTSPPADLATPFFNPWGQVYWPSDAPNANNYGCRVEIRDMQAWLLKKSDLSWHLAYPSTIPLTGAWYNEDFTGSTTGATVDRSRPGSIMSYVPAAKLFHFYPNTARVAVDKDDVFGVAVSVRARLTLIADPTKTPEWYVNMGADYWPDDISGPVRGVGQGRLKRLEPAWRVFSYTTHPSIPFGTDENAEWR